MTDSSVEPLTKSGLHTIPVTVMVFTLNEEANLLGCLHSVTWSDDVIIVDSGSTDATRSICESYKARFFEHPFQGFGSQRNWAIQTTNPKYDWILILDADEKVPSELAREIAQKTKDAHPGVGAFRVRRRFFQWGRWLRYSGLYPTWVVRLVHKDRVRYVDRGHAETQVVEGEIHHLEHDLIDENNKSIEAWFARQNRYSTKDAEYELLQADSSLKFCELFSRKPLQRRAALKRLGYKVPGRPLWYFIYTYIFRGGFLEGRDGLTFCMMRAMYQGMITAKKYDARRRDIR